MLHNLVVIATDCIGFYFIRMLVFNATFSNISAISWWKKPEYPERTTDHGQATGKLYHLRLQVECTFFCNLQSWARTHAVLVIGMYELLGNSLSHPCPHNSLSQPGPPNSLGHPGPLTH